jgi:hypothetical protein
VTPAEKGTWEVTVTLSGDPERPLADCVVVYAVMESELQRWARRDGTETGDPAVLLGTPGECVVFGRVRGGGIVSAGAEFLGALSRACAIAGLPSWWRVTKLVAEEAIR